MRKATDDDIFKKHVCFLKISKLQLLLNNKWNQLSKCDMIKGNESDVGNIDFELQFLSTYKKGFFNMFSYISSAISAIIEPILGMLVLF